MLECTALCLRSLLIRFVSSRQPRGGAVGLGRGQGKVVSSAEEHDLGTIAYFGEVMGDHESVRARARASGRTLARRRSHVCTYARVYNTKA